MLGRDHRDSVQSPRRRLARRIGTIAALALLAAPFVAAEPAAAKANYTSTFMYSQTGDTVPYGTDVVLHVIVDDDSQSCQTIFDDCDNPEGTVVVTANGAEVGRGTLQPGYNNNEESFVYITLEKPNAGFYPLYARYYPYTTEFASSAYGYVSLTVTKLDCSITLRQDATQTYTGEKVTFSADLGRTGHSGTITFTDQAGNVLGTTSELFFGAIGKFETTSLPAGTTQVKATFSSPNWNSCTSNAVSHTVAARRAPVADAGGPYAAVEGEVIPLDGSLSDPGAGPGVAGLTYEWDLDYDGSYDDATGATPTYRAGDDGYSHLGLRVRNGGGAVDTDYSWVSIYNVAPTVSPSITGDRLEGSVISLGGTVSDPADAVSVSVDWGDGSPVENALGAAASAGGTTFALKGSHVYGDNGAYTVTTCARDDWTSTCSEHEVEIANVAPSVLIEPAATSFAEGGTASLRATVTDPGVRDTQTVEIDWGAGDGFEAIEPGTELTRPFGDNGVFTATIRAADDDGATTLVTSTVDVANVAPTASIDESGAVQTAGGLVLIGGSGGGLAADATDPGSDDLTAVWDLGLGGPGPDATETSRVDPSMPDPFPSPTVDPRTVRFSAGLAGAEPCLYQANLAIADDDGGSAALDSMTVLVQGADADAHVAGWWAMQYNTPAAGGHEQLSDARLDCYLTGVRFLSAAFGEVTALDDSADAVSVLRPRGPATARDRLRSAVLAGWLNIANGGFAPGDAVDEDTDVLGALRAAETALLDQGASNTTLKQQHDIIERAIRADTRH